MFLDVIKEKLSECWLPHSFKDIKKNENYVYKECTRCKLRTVEIKHLQKDLPDYDWVNHNKDTL